MMNNVWHRLRVVAAAFLIAVSVTSCATMQQHIGKITGAVTGAAVGALACDGDWKCAAAGGAAGYMLGALWDKRTLRLAELAEKEAIDIETKRVKTFNNKSLLDNALEVSIASAEMFSVGSAKLTADAARQFKLVAGIYVENPQKVLIMGHTDSSGGSNGNQRLSEKRAKALAKLFAAAGVLEDNIYFQGAGESQPVADNSTDLGRAKNRRVEVVEIDSVESLSAYSLARNSDLEYISTVKRQISAVVAPVQPRKATHKEVVADSHNSAELKSQRKEDSPSAPEVKSDQAAAVLVDFAGSPLLELSNLRSAVGSTSNNSFAMQLISSAHAEDEFLPSCAESEPRMQGVVKKLTDNQALKHADYRTSAYWPGAAKTAWIDAVNDHYVAINRLAILAGSGEALPGAEIVVIKDANHGGKEQWKAPIKAETYLGDRGLVYRAYFDNDYPISCFDVVLPKKKPFVAKMGRIYYAHPRGVYEKPFEPRSLIGS